MGVEVELKVVHDLASLLWQTVLLDQRHNGQLHGSERCGQLEHHAGLAVLELLLTVRVAHDAEEHAVHTDRGLDVVGSVALVLLRIKIFDALARELLVQREVIVGTAVNALHLLEAERHLKLDVGGSVGIVGELLVIVEAIVLRAEAQSLVPLHTDLLPLCEPLHLGAGLNEELHLHLLKLAHAEDKLTCHNLVTESLAYLCDTERNLHAACLLNVQIVHEDALSCLWTEVDFACRVGSRSHLCREHEVKLAHVSPVFCSADGVYNLLVKDDLLQRIEVRTLHGSLVTLVQRIALLLVLQHARVGLHKLCLVEGIAETLLCLGNLLGNLLVILGDLVLNEHIGTITLL